MTDTMEPNVDNPEVKEPAVQEPAVPDTEEMTAELLEQLKLYGVEDSETLNNKMTAASESGRLANYLGEARQENQMLRQEIQRLREDMLSRRPHKSDDFDYDNPEPASVDLERVIEDKMNSVLNNFVTNINKQQAEANRAYAEVANDKYYGAVKPVLDKHLNNPQVQAALQEGRTTLRQEYDRIVIAYQGEMLKKTNTVLQGLADKKVKPPHVEGTNFVEPDKTELAKRDAKLKELRTKQYPSDADLSEYIKTILPDDDPIFRS